jgi:conjugal transfer mating pair stabilization protein TraN
VQCPDGAPCRSTAQGLQCEYFAPASICNVNSNPVSAGVTSCFTSVTSPCPPGSTPTTAGCLQTTTTLTCPNGGTLSGSTCIVDSSYAAVRSCPQGGAITIDGTRCIGVFYDYFCPNGGTLSGTTCFVDNSYAASSSTTTTHTTSIIQSVNGTVSTRASQTTAAPTRSLRVTTTSNQISVISYQSAGQTGATTTLSHTPSSPAITGTLGLIKSPSTSNQTSSVDNFRAS